MKKFFYFICIYCKLHKTLGTLSCTSLGYRSRNLYNILCLPDHRKYHLQCCSCKLNTIIVKIIVKNIVLEKCWYEYLRKIISIPSILSLPQTQQLCSGQLYVFPNVQSDPGVGYPFLHQNKAYIWDMNNIFDRSF